MIREMRILSDEVSGSILGFDTEHSDWGFLWHLKLSYDYFLPYPDQFIIHSANWHYTECPRNKCGKLDDEWYAQKQWKYFVATYARRCLGSKLEPFEDVTGKSRIVQLLLQK